MRDRGMIKWQPFDSVMSSKVTVNNLVNERNKIKMPELSEEQIYVIESLIKESYTNKELMRFYYFKNGKIFRKDNIVKLIDTIFNKVIFSDNTYIFFNQIINIKKM